MTFSYSAFGTVAAPKVAAAGGDQVFSLKNYPNPFNPSTTISYTLPEISNVRLTIYNILGQQVRTLINDRQAAGIATVQWDGRDDAGRSVASGLYFYRLTVGKFTQTQKMLLLK